jgi:hypothetical protein
MRVAAGEPIRGMNIDDINCREGDEVTQALQGGSVRARAIAPWLRKAWVGYRAASQSRYVEEE